VRLEIRGRGTAERIALSLRPNKPPMAPEHALGTGLALADLADDPA